MAELPMTDAEIEAIAATGQIPVSQVRTIVWLTVLAMERQQEGCDDPA